MARMTTLESVRPRLTLKSILAHLRGVRSSGTPSTPVIRDHPWVTEALREVEDTRLARIELLIETWAEIQTEALMRRILSAPSHAWMTFRTETVR